MIKQIAIRGFDKNFSYFIVNSQSEIAVVDPGDLPRLQEAIAAGPFSVRMILVTHSHFDHIEGVAEMCQKYQVPVYMHEDAAGRVQVPDERKTLLKDGDVVELGDLKIDVLHTPGHIGDAVCFYLEEQGELITGDTVFVEGCGRADLEGSDVEALYNSLQCVKQLPDSVQIFPGHDYGSRPISTIAHEKANNRYFIAESLEEFRAMRLP